MVMACWQWRHTIYMGVLSKVSPYNTVTMVAAPEGTRTVAVWLPGLG